MEVFLLYKLVIPVSVMFILMSTTCVQCDPINSSDLMINPAISTNIDSITPAINSTNPPQSSGKGDLEMSAQHYQPQYFHHESGSGQKKSHHGNRGHGHHGKKHNYHKNNDHHNKHWMNEDYDKHGGHHENREKDSHDNHWNDWGEKERYVKDRGHGFIKAFSWDREEGVKDNWGSKGGSKNTHESSGKGSSYGSKGSKRKGSIDWSKAVLDDASSDWGGHANEADFGLNYGNHFDPANDANLLGNKNNNLWSPMNPGLSLSLWGLLG